MSKQEINLVIYGAGGFGKEIACMLVHQLPSFLEQTYRFIGFVDDGREIGEEIKYGKILGDVSYINHYPGPLAVVFAIANPLILFRAFEKIERTDIDYPNLISPGVTFYDSPSFKMGRGNILFNGARISCDVNLGDFNLFNGFVALGHDVCVGNFNVFGPSSRISGDVSVGNKNFFGLNSAVLQGCKVGNEIRLGAGSILIKNAMSTGSLYFGNPARLVVS
jgi:sugar O-acyltransferase (sialic acid O-acetyltransferase NeuD family)